MMSELPAVSVTMVSGIGTSIEVGSRKSHENVLFIIEVISRADGERSDICDIIYRDSTKILLVETNDLLPIDNEKQTRFFNLHGKYFGAISLEVIDNKCEK